jgi:uncharacterized membrane protein YheB (UPF0754 family)
MNIREETKNLLDQLNGLGYHPFQVKQIIQDATGSTDLKTITPEQNQKLLEALQEYIQFAQKCRTVQRLSRSVCQNQGDV